MLKLKEIKDQQKWDDLILDNNSHPFQLWGWGEVKATHGWKRDRLVLLLDDNTMEALQVLTKKLPWPLKNFSYIPRGLISEEVSEEAYNRVAEFVKGKYQSVVLSIEPHSFDKVNYKGWKRINNQNSILVDQTILIDLTQPEEKILANMGRKTRQSINKAKRNTDEIRQITNLDELQKCLDIYEQTSKRSDFAIHSRKYYETVFGELKSNSVIYGAYINGELVGFLWLAISGSVAYQMYSGINSIGAKNRVNYALRWHSIVKAKEWGLKDYDFGGLMPGGVEAFKKGWSTQSTQFSGAYDKPLSIWYPLWKYGKPIASQVNQQIKVIKRNAKRS